MEKQKKKQPSAAQRRAWAKLAQMGRERAAAVKGATTMTKKNDNSNGGRRRLPKMSLKGTRITSLMPAAKVVLETVYGVPGKFVGARAAYLNGGMKPALQEGGKVLIAGLSGYDVDARKFKHLSMPATTLGIAWAGDKVSKAASSLGVNRLVRRLTNGWVKI